MSLSEKMTALCRTLGIARDVPVRLALDMMEKNMGLESGGSWPDRADRLMLAVGVTLDGTPTAPVATPTASVATPPVHRLRPAHPHRADQWYCKAFHKG